MKRRKFHQQQQFKMAATTTKAKYTPKKGEENTVVAEIQIKGFDPETGEPLHKPFEYRTDVTSWNTSFLVYYPTQGYKINKVIYLPKGGIDPNSPQAKSMLFGGLQEGKKAKK